MTVCGAIYRREIVSKIDWEKTNYNNYEDNIWTLRLLEFANSGIYIPYRGYLYRYDDSIRDTRNKKTEGNHFGGKPIGYLEFFDILIKEFHRYNKKYKIGADKEIEKIASSEWANRLSRLMKYGRLDSENNESYLKKGLPYLCAEYEKQMGNNSKLRDEVTKLQSENEMLKAELNSFLSIKRSVKLTVGNIKRRLTR
jgi:hypothetical protein